MTTKMEFTKITIDNFINNLIKYNNIDKILKNISKLKLIKIHDVHHGNILSKEKLIVSECVVWSSKL